jgi:hypothetical protein
VLQLKAEHAAIEAERAVEIGDLQVHMADPRADNDGGIFRHAVPPGCRNSPASRAARL